jgi:hypothetical protein
MIGADEEYLFHGLSDEYCEPKVPYSFHVRPSFLELRNYGDTPVFIHFASSRGFALRRLRHEAMQVTKEKTNVQSHYVHRTRRRIRSHLQHSFRRAGRFFFLWHRRLAFWPPVCVERRNNATLALARYFLPPSPSALCPVSVHSARGFFCRTIA